MSNSDQPNKNPGVAETVGKAVDEAMTSSVEAGKKIVDTVMPAALEVSKEAVEKAKEAADKASAMVNEAFTSGMGVFKNMLDSVTKKD